MIIALTNSHWRRNHHAQSAARFFAASTLLVLLIGCAGKAPPTQEPAGEQEKPKPPSPAITSKPQDPKGAKNSSEDTLSLTPLPDQVITEIPYNPFGTGLKSRLHFCGFSADCKRLVAVDDEGGVAVMDSTTWKPIKTFAVPEPFKQAGFQSIQVALSADGKRLAFGCRDKTAHLWNVETGKEERRLKGHPDFVRYLAFSPDGTKLVIGTNEQDMFVWDAATGDLLKKIPHGFGIVSYIAFTPDGKELLASSWPTIDRFDLQTGAALGKIKAANSGGPIALSARPIALSADGKMVATAMYGLDREKRNDATVCDRASGATLYTVPGFKDGIQELAFVSDSILAVLGDTGVKNGFQGAVNGSQIHLWDLKSKKQLSRFPIIAPFAVSSDGKILVHSAGGAITELSLQIVELPPLLKEK